MIPETLTVSQLPFAIACLWVALCAAVAVLIRLQSDE